MDLDQCNFISPAYRIPLSSPTPVAAASAVATAALSLILAAAAIAILNAKRQHAQRGSDLDASLKEEIEARREAASNT